MSDQSSPSNQPVARSNVQATVKWFNPAKRFGFLEFPDGSPDAFLHISVLERAGHDSVTPGAQVTCDLVDGERGPMVAAIHDLVDVEAPRPEKRFQPSSRPVPEGRHHGPEQTVDGTVKFFDLRKGYGFILPDQGGRDVFVGARVIERAGLTGLEPEQRVRVTAADGDKGPIAQSIQLI